MGLSKHGSLAWFFRRTISPPIGGNIMQRQRVLTMGVVRKHVRNSFFISLISTLVLRHPRKSASKLVTLVPKVADTKTHARAHTHTHSTLFLSPSLSPLSLLFPFSPLPPHPSFPPSRRILRVPCRRKPRQAAAPAGGSQTARTEESPSSFFGSMMRRHL